MAENSTLKQTRSASTEDRASNNKFRIGAVKLQTINSSQTLENPQQTIINNTQTLMLIEENKSGTLIVQEYYLQTTYN